MAKRRNPQNRILEYFDSVPIDEATSVLAVCQWIVSKRTGGTAAKPRASRKPRAIATSEELPRAANG